MTLRWKIAVMVCAAIAISYLDRQTLPVAIKSIRQDIPVSNEQFAFLNTCFLVAYGAMYAVGGRMVDALGTRAGFTAVMVFWSLACASHGLAVTFGMLAASRLLLGIGEGGGFPAATRAVAEWFPVRERSTAMGVINAGSAVGGVVAVPLIAGVISLADWRWVFFITGAFGLAWTVWWWCEYYPPERHPRLGEAERKHLGIAAPAGEPPAGEPPTANRTGWLQLLGYRKTWGIVAAKFLSDAAWYFILFWLPKYLYDARGLDVKAVGAFAWIPFVAAGLGCLSGGWLSSRLLGLGYSLNRSRKLALALSAAVMPAVLLVPSANLFWAIAIISLAYFGQQSWSTLVMVLPADLFPKHSVGAVAGLVGFGGAMGGVVFGQLVGYLLDNNGNDYAPAFALAASFHVLGFILICVAVPSIPDAPAPQTSPGTA